MYRYQSNNTRNRWNNMTYNSLCNFSLHRTIQVTLLSCILRCLSRKSEHPVGVGFLYTGVCSSLYFFLFLHPIMVYTHGSRSSVNFMVRQSAWCSIACSSNQFVTIFAVVNDREICRRQYHYSIWSLSSNAENSLCTILIFLHRNFTEKFCSWN